MRRRWMQILMGMMALVSVVILAMPFLMTVGMLFSGSRLTSIEVTWTETYFYTASPGINPFLSGILFIPTWIVILWGLASLVLMMLMFTMGVRWWYQTGVLTSYTTRQQDVATISKS